ncbi:hypothetical protein BDN71DRAFT_1509708 [Pleurotus eryngii]|uniref:Peptidase A2 domain-containing protein n=1 Tax=Pleurotus eryngii TaxID=5323 RepID=A0A9P6DDM5_PLEER|nr:hypothetical protein BDN71DRAFT_1509708 [Pleurotus eryngii]
MRVARTVEANNNNDISLLISAPTEEVSSPSSAEDKTILLSDEDSAESFLKEVHWTEGLSNPFDAPRNSEVAFRQPRLAEGPKLIRAIRCHRFLEGHGSIGICALHLQAHIGSLDASPFIARLDSGADVTLMSEEFLKTLTDPPDIKEGIQMQLY